MNKKVIDVVLMVAIVAALYFFVYKKFLSPSAKDKEFLQNLGFGVADRMTDSEIIAAATYIRDYTQKGRRPVPGSALAQAVNQLHNKYNIF